MPIAWLTLILSNRVSLRKFNLVSCSLLCVTLLASAIALQTELVSNLPVPIRILISPVLHADYLHLCLNILGSYLVMGRFEESNGTRQTAVLLFSTYLCQVFIVALTVYLVRMPIDILGISCLVFASFGHIVQQNFRRLSNVEKNTFVTAMVLMVIIEVSLRSIIAHGLAMALGAGLAFAKSKSTG
jgi:membrane associated rhomboid family serine protease